MGNAKVGRRDNKGEMEGGGQNTRKIKEIGQGRGGKEDRRREKVNKRRERR